MKFFTDLSSYKKLKMAIAGIIIVVVTAYIPEIDEAALTKIVYIIISFIFGQGLADFAKEGKN